MASTTTAAKAHVTSATMSGDRYRVIDLRAGKPGTADWWYSQLMASNLEVVEAAGIKQ